jgi:hypothetical protein
MAGSSTGGSFSLGCALVSRGVERDVDNVFERL